MADEETPTQGELAITRTGDKLRQAREAAGLSIADIASRTRINTRHLEAIEKSDFSAIPGRTYIGGFARAYARAVDLPEAEISAAVRKELEVESYAGRPTLEPYEPNDPDRLPTAKFAWALVIIVLLLASAYGVWRFLSVEPEDALIASRNNNAEQTDAPDATATPGTTAAGTAAPVSAAADAPVILTSTGQPVWIGFDDEKGKSINYRTLNPGQIYTVPAEYIQQFTLRTSRAQDLKITVGGRDVGSIGPADTLVKNISLKPADLIARVNNAGTATTPPAAGAAPKR